MPYYGVASGGLAYTATEQNDTVTLLGNATAQVSAATVNGLAGADLISFGAVGQTAIASANYSGFFSGGASDVSGEAISGYLSYAITAELVGSATYKRGFSGTVSGAVSGLSVTTGVGVTGIITAQRGARVFNLASIEAGDGNDTVFLGNYISGFSATTVALGEGNDRLGFDGYVDSVIATGNNTGLSLNNVNIQGGAGNDSLDLVFNAEATMVSATFQGGLGNDLLEIDNQNGSISASQLFGGGGNDTLTLQLSALAYTTIAAGGGNDRLTLSADASGSNLLILGDAFNSLNVDDGDDIITGDFAAAYSGVTVQGMGGNDSITILGSQSNDGGNNVYQLNTGNDSIFLSALSASTIEAGAGNDTISVGATTKDGSLIMGGGGADEIIISGISGSLVAGTIFGGAGADVIGTGISGAGGTLGAQFGYSAFSDSTLSAMDTIAVAGGSGTYNFRYTPGGLTRASDTSNSTLSGANGVFNFTSTFSTDLTARVEAIDSLVTTANAVAVFSDSSSKSYLFIQGGTGNDDLLVQAGSDAAAAFTESTLAVTTNLATFTKG
jgi:Ca2+-binding RTX toxin-like protein